MLCCVDSTIAQHTAEKVDIIHTVGRTFVNWWTL